MAFFLFLGGFCAAALGIYMLYHIIRNRIRSFSRRVFGRTDLLGALESVNLSAQQNPRSLNGCDSLLLPQILKDFPDFDVNQAKILIRDVLKKQYGDNEDFRIYNVVIAKYLRSGAQKTIVFQASVSWMENGRTLQKRFDIHYAYILPQSSETVAANCPNCGGAIGYGETECSYCGSRVVSILGNTWKAVQILET